MVATTGLTGKTSAQATTEVMDSNILTLMRIESGSKFHNILLNLKCNLYNVNLYGYYCEVVILREDNGETLTTGSVVRLGIDPITPEISLDEKVECFTGSEINIDDVLISNIVESDEFDVEYLYYLDEECTVLTSKANSGAIVDGGAPVNVGSYYVKVTVSGNSNYNEVSSISKVTILEVVVPPVEEEEDEKNPLTLDKIILVVVASILGIVVAIRCLPFVFKY
mgnify:CR=1 FL=1